MNDDTTDALEAAGLLQDEYPDEMARRSCTCEDDAPPCGAHRLLARYAQLFDAFQQSNREKREAKAALRACDADLATARAEVEDWKGWAGKDLREAHAALDTARSYMRHKSGCAQWTSPSAGGPPCDCGYFEALVSVSPPASRDDE